MSKWPEYICQKDLAKGDIQIHPDFPSDTRLHRIESLSDPYFERVFEALWEQFGEAREMETRAVIESRFQWKGRQMKGEKHMDYHLQAIVKGDSIVGMRDHSVIADASGDTVVIHMSHILIPPEWRRKGIVSALRTLPIADARALAQSMGRPNAPIILFCEMDPLDLTDPPNRIRRLSYEKAEFMGIPGGHGYMQPDFRDASVIEADPKKAQPVELDLLFRFINTATPTSLSKTTLLESIHNIYAMYSLGLKTDHMETCNHWLSGFEQTAQQTYPLLPPTQTFRSAS